MNILYSNNEKLIQEIGNNTIITNYGEACTRNGKVVFESFSPFPLFEDIVIISTSYPSAGLEEMITEITQDMDELEKMHFLSSLALSKKYGTSFSYYEDIITHILNLFSRRDEMDNIGVKRGVFTIKERWDIYGDLIDRWFSIDEYEESDISPFPHYTFGFIKVSMMPEQVRDLLKDRILISDNWILGLYGNFLSPISPVYILSKTPLVKEDLPLIWLSGFETISRDGISFLEKFNKYIKNFQLDGKIFEVAKKIKETEIIEEIDLISLVNLIEIRLTLTDGKKTDWDIEKKVKFELIPLDFPFLFRVRFLLEEG